VKDGGSVIDIKDLEAAATKYYDVPDGLHTSKVIDTDLFAQLLVIKCCDFLKDILDDSFAADELRDYFDI
jgi:hypothetical protein